MAQTTQLYLGANSLRVFLESYMLLPGAKHKLR